MSGYSKTPLAKKLGIKEGYTIKLIDAPHHYFKLFDDFPEAVQIETGDQTHHYDFIHLFCATLESLHIRGLEVKDQLKKTGLLWVSWPKGSSGIKTDINRESVRNHLLSIGLVDVKVCSVDSHWSGLKFVYRLKDRN